MAAKNQLFQVDDIIVDGVAIAFESGTAELEGIAGYELVGWNVLYAPSCWLTMSRR